MGNRLVVRPVGAHEHPRDVLLNRQGGCRKTGGLEDVTQSGEGGRRRTATVGRLRASRLSSSRANCASARCAWYRVVAQFQRFLRAQAGRYLHRVAGGLVSGLLVCVRTDRGFPCQPKHERRPEACASWSRMMSVMTASEIQRPLCAESLGNSRLVMNRSKPIAALTRSAGSRSCRRWRARRWCGNRVSSVR